MKNHNLHNTS